MTTTPEPKVLSTFERELESLQNIAKDNGKIHEELKAANASIEKAEQEVSKLQDKRIKISEKLYFDVERLDFLRRSVSALYGYRSREVVLSEVYPGLKHGNYYDVMRRIDGGVFSITSITLQDDMYYIEYTSTLRGAYHFQRAVRTNNPNIPGYEDVLMIPKAWFEDRVGEIRKLNGMAAEAKRDREETRRKDEIRDDFKRAIRRAGGDQKDLSQDGTGSLLREGDFIGLVDTLDQKKEKEFFYPYAAVLSLLDYAKTMKWEGVHVGDIEKFFTTPLSRKSSEGIPHENALNRLHLDTFVEIAKQYKQD